MSVAARRWVEEYSTVKGSARAVLEKLAWYAQHDDGRGARRPQDVIARDTGLSRATVQRALGRLQADGHVRRHERGCGCRECVRAARGVVVYDVVVGELPAPGQLVLTPSTGITLDRPHDQHQPHGDAGDLPQDEAGTGLTVRPLKDVRTTSRTTSQKGKRVSAGEDGLPFEFRHGRPPRSTRRRQRAGTSGSHVVVEPPAPCPLGQLGEPRRVELVQAWLPASSRLRTAVGEGTFEIWLASLHLHDIDEDGRLLLGAPETVRPWVEGRFRKTLSVCAGAPWEIASCAGLPAAGREAIGATA